MTRTQVAASTRSINSKLRFHATLIDRDDHRPNPWFGSVFTVYVERRRDVIQPSASRPETVPLHASEAATDPAVMANEFYFTKSMSSPGHAIAPRHLLEVIDFSETCSNASLFSFQLSLRHGGGSSSSSSDQNILHTPR